jgi:hypothetical protein
MWESGRTEYVRAGSESLAFVEADALADPDEDGDIWRVERVGEEDEEE